MVMKIKADKKKKKVQTVLERLIEHEGFRLDPYKDTKGYLTGGIGHKMTEADVKEFDPNWSDDQKHMYWIGKFEQDYAVAEKAATRMMKKYGIEENQHIKEVLIDMAFNMGASFDKKFPKFMKALAEKNVARALYEMYHNSKGGDSQWYKDVGKRVDNLAEIIKEYL